MPEPPIPLVGFSALSGTGKTTLLTSMLPLLKERGVRVGAIKHAHHRFEVDYRNKDSYRLRKAGAEQMLVASRNRVVVIAEREATSGEPSLAELLRRMDTSCLDLILVEGFKREHFPKIELHRPLLGHPLRYPHDPDIIAIASDRPLTTTPCHLPLLDINRPLQVVDFLLQHFFHRGQIRSTGDQQRLAHRIR
ncbi:MAG: molybdopterin-guanine dinucleotide biosynthesis protein B [Sedimenticola sp.]|nr:molybdopterin-guanine dinucleotide biosynthesis protein B [Sedimenticola sp.]